jgi:hypothetical protein
VKLLSSIFNSILIYVSGRDLQALPDHLRTCGVRQVRCLQTRRRMWHHSGCTGEQLLIILVLCTIWLLLSHGHFKYFFWLCYTLLPFYFVVMNRHCNNKSTRYVRTTDSSFEHIIVDWKAALCYFESKKNLKHYSNNFLEIAFPEEKSFLQTNQNTTYLNLGNGFY